MSILDKFKNNSGVNENSDDVRITKSPNAIYIILMVVLGIILVASRFTSDKSKLSEAEKKPKVNVEKINPANLDSIREQLKKRMSIQGSIPQKKQKGVFENSILQDFQNKFKRGGDGQESEPVDPVEEFLNSQRLSLYSDLTSGDYREVSFGSSFDVKSVGNINDSASVLAIGSVIKVMLRTNIVSDYVGSDWFGIVSNDVYDFNNEFVLIDKGAIVTGDVVSINSANPMVENKMALVINKVKRNDGYIIDFNLSVSGDDGVGGIKGDVDSHSFKKWGGFTAFALLGNGIALATDAGDDVEARSSADQALRDITSNVQSQTSNVASQYLAIQKTIKLYVGDDVNIMIHNDMKVKPVRRIYE